MSSSSVSTPPPAAISVEDLVKRSVTEAWTLFTSDALLFLLAPIVVVLLSAISFGILSGPLTVGLIQLVRKRRRGQPGAVGDVFGGFASFGASFVAMILLAIAFAIGTALLIVPGLLVLLFGAWTFHAMTYRGLSAFAAIEACAEGSPVAEVALLEPTPIQCGHRPVSHAEPPLLKAIYHHEIGAPAVNLRKQKPSLIPRNRESR